MSPKSSDLIGKTFNKLTVLRDSGKREHRKVIFTCSCVCGNIVDVRGANLLAGRTKSCGKCKSEIETEYRLCLEFLSYYKIKNYIITPDNLLELPEFNLVIHFVSISATKIQGISSTLIHSIKTSYNLLGYRCITIYEPEWTTRRLQVMNLLSSVLHKFDYKIHARKCSVVVISKEVAKTFLNSTHIQGYGKGSLYFFGLVEKATGELVAVMTFSKHHREIKDSDGLIILNRFSLRKDAHIPGAASKLLTFAETVLKTAGITKIISWADLRFSEGNLYRQLKFTEDSKLSPDYCYFNSLTNSLESKQANKKSCLNTPSGMTELEHTRQLGKYRLYDCGKLRFIKHI